MRGYFHHAGRWAMLVVGGAVGGLFAAFSFAISVFAIPMLLNEDVDALTAMGSSMALMWNNLPTMPTWGAIVRERTGVSQAVMAAFLNVAVSTISQWERGEREEEVGDRLGHGVARIRVGESCARRRLRHEARSA